MHTQRHITRIHYEEEAIGANVLMGIRSIV